MLYGKYAGVELNEVPPAYLIWMKENGYLKGDLLKMVIFNLAILKQEAEEWENIQLWKLRFREILNQAK